MKTILYIIMIACYAGAGALEASQGNVKPSVLALAFGAINAIIFLWKP